ncbi:MAG: PQQ-binding-like beta-propeller repeat protein [Deltaproteobacteria bacterium]|nr:PQQ-binding-like beta-propeller repeat protein [Deltaproteobacteria bacterium]
MGESAAATIAATPTAEGVEAPDSFRAIGKVTMQDDGATVFFNLDNPVWWTSYAEEGDLWYGWSDGEAPITYTRLYRSDSLQGEWTLISQSTPSSTHRLDSDLSPGIYYYAATAVNAAELASPITGPYHGVRINPPWVAHNVRPFIDPEHPTGSDIFFYSMDFIDGATGYGVVHENEPASWRGLVGDNVNWTQYYEYLLKTTDGGLNWSVAGQLQVGDSAQHASVILFLDDQHGLRYLDHVEYSRAWFTGIDMTADGGASWSSHDPNETERMNWNYRPAEQRKDWSGVEHLYFAAMDHADNRIFLVGNDGLILRSDDGGDNWVCLSLTGMESDFHTVLVLDADTIYIGGDNGTLVKSVDGGETWTPLVLPTTSPVHALFFTDAAHGFAGTTFRDINTTILKTTDSGETWTPAQVHLAQENRAGHHRLIGIIGIDDNHLWAQTEYGYLLYSSDGGANWIAEGIQPDKGEYAEAYIRGPGKLALVDQAQYPLVLAAGWRNFTYRLDIAAYTPEAPGNLAAHPSFDEVFLSWDNQDPNATGFVIEMQQDPDGPWTELAGELSSDLRRYTATGLNYETAYSFRVRSRNGQLLSEASDVVQTTTLADPLLWSFGTESGQVTSSPAVGRDGLVYVGIGTRLYCIDPDTGLSLWNFQTFGNIFGSPALGPDGTAYVSSFDGKLYAVDTVNHIEKWSFNVGNAVYSGAAVLPEGTVYTAFPDYKVYAFGAGDGDVLWTAETANHISTTVSVAPDGIVYIGSSNLHLYGLRPADGEMTMDYPVNSAGRGVTIDDDGVLYQATGDKRLLAIEPAGPTLLWEVTVKGFFRTSPVIGPNGILYAGTSANRLHAINSRTGEILWSFTMEGGAGTAPAVAADGTVYVGGTDGRLYAVNGETGELIWTYRTNGSLESSPTILPNGSVIFGSRDGKLYALKTGNGGLAVSPWPKYRQDVANTGIAGTDREITLEDVIVILRIQAGMVPARIPNAGWDINGDDRLGMEEVVYALQLLSGLGTP